MMARGMKLMGNGGLAKATVKGSAVVFIALLAIYIYRLFLDSDAWGKFFLSIFAFSAIFDAWCILNEEKRRE
jgi:hypothetical protein